MLILTRYEGQSIIIGDREITFTVMGVRGHQVKIGINADKSISIHREEVFERIKEEEGAIENGQEGRSS